MRRPAPMGGLSRVRPMVQPFGGIIAGKVARKVPNALPRSDLSADQRMQQARDPACIHEW
jgi:hypothetical protein